MQHLLGIAEGPARKSMELDGRLWGACASAVPIENPASEDVIVVVPQVDAARVNVAAQAARQACGPCVSMLATEHGHAVAALESAVGDPAAQSTAAQKRSRP